eukprot:CAMPEP_0177642020 /NCGR_PEP_ID=MMETSP0447-20121125/7368_1 /TAXON_ID=0 /ORGANISM="Stygamoeba regulata, Strain BSH-02190019" /LENGTH=291 /DNA_ID=CAMNT_0019144159 /DNA_START=373 /DNA_END=1248 /DNA_ORIENTATION=+
MTSVQSTTLNPRWTDGKYEFNASLFPKWVFRVQVWDKDTVSKDDYMGELTFTQEIFSGSMHVDGWFSLHAPKKGPHRKAKIKGKLRLILNYHDEGTLLRTKSSIAASQVSCLLPLLELWLDPISENSNKFWVNMWPLIKSLVIERRLELKLHMYPLPCFRNSFTLCRLGIAIKETHAVKFLKWFCLILRNHDRLTDIATYNMTEAQVRDLIIEISVKAGIDAEFVHDTLDPGKSSSFDGAMKLWRAAAHTGITSLPFVMYQKESWNTKYIQTAEDFLQKLEECENKFEDIY